ncbi:hypothetical protein C8F01DRAFT_1136175 [Mycena amicta]|nr:hypothetical protein C8F01DRAFT_1136175 [Mycena amicta]
MTAQTLKARIDEAPNRPILSSLNGDNTWLFSFPIPAAARTQGGKAYYHVVSDAWLGGPTGMGGRWIIHIEMVNEPTIRDSKGVDAVVREIELAAGHGHGSETATAVDAIFVCLSYPDHLHEPTLRTFDPSIPVFAVPEAAGTINGWKHFSSAVVEMRNFDSALLNFATAIMWSPSVESEEHEAIVYSPHGILTDQPSISTFLSTPHISVLAILHGLKLSYSFGIQTTFGVPGGLALERLAKPRYWVKTHDAPLIYSGVVMFLGWVTDYFKTLDEGLEMEAKGKSKGARPNFVEVAMGDSFVLA